MMSHAELELELDEIGAAVLCAGCCWRRKE